MLKYILEIWRRLQRRRVNIPRISSKEILKLKAGYYRKEDILKSAVTSSRNEIWIFKVSQFEFELHWTQKSVCLVLECFNESDHNEAQCNLHQHACPLVLELRRQRSQKSRSWQVVRKTEVMHLMFYPSVSLCTSLSPPACLNYCNLNKCTSSLDFIYTNQSTLYTQMYQSFKHTLKSLKTL